jgi:hypothetical protein
MLHKIENFFYAIGGDEAVNFLDDLLLEPFVKIPWLENPIRSYRLQEKDIKAMSKKGYRIFDGEIRRFVKEWPKSSRFV